MALTSRNIVGSQAQGPQSTGNFSALGPADVPSSTADDAAADIYGAPGDATRMNRMKNIANEALDDGVTGSYNDGPAFIDGGEASGFGEVSDFGDAASLPGSPGFPGIPDPARTQGTDISVSTQGGRGSSGTPSIGGAPGFPGLP